MDVSRSLTGFKLQYKNSHWGEHRPNGAMGQYAMPLVFSGLNLSILSRVLRTFKPGFNAYYVNYCLSFEVYMPKCGNFGQNFPFVPIAERRRSAADEASGSGWTGEPNGDI